MSKQDDQTTGWQPIETAPKTDGIVVMLWCRENGPVLAYYSLAGWTPVAFGECIFDEAGNSKNVSDWETDIKWWKPIDAPPGEDVSIANV